MANSLKVSFVLRGVVLGIVGFAIAGLLQYQLSAQVVTVEAGETPTSHRGPILMPLTDWPVMLSPQDDLLSDWEIDARTALLTAIDQSLRYLDSPEAEQAYEEYPMPTITHARVRRSLQRFRGLLLTSLTAEDFYQRVQETFTLYQSVGHDGRGNVHFTGYFEPTFSASRYRDNDHRFPLYRRPLDLEAWPLPHPTRSDLEGPDGLQGSNGPLNGLELVWLRDRLEAFLIQVQGSARLQLTDGTSLAVGYAGRTEYPYTSIGRELVNDGEIPADGLTLDRLIAYFQTHPAALDRYLPRNDRFIFFQETTADAPIGTFSVPVTAGRSIAMDKALMPPGAIALITLEDSSSASPGKLIPPLNRYVLNQDTGGAITGPGRVDIFMGSGTAAGRVAGQINTPGKLFYLLLDP